MADKEDIKNLERELSELKTELEKTKIEDA